jgi:hypothetical protein
MLVFGRGPKFYENEFSDELDFGILKFYSNITGYESEKGKGAISSSSDLLI